MTTDDRISRRGGSGRIWAGLFLLLVGAVLLLDQMGFPLPGWLFSWHVLLIALGLFIGLRHGFRGGAWLVMIVVGSVFLFQDYYPDTHIHRFIWPGILIFAGLAIIMRPGRSRYSQEWRNDRDRHRWERRWGRFGGPGGYGGPGGHGDPGGFGGPGGAGGPGGHVDPRDAGRPDGSGSASAPGGPGATASGGAFGSNYSSEDFIDTTSIFGGVHKRIVSKNFKGGDITTMLGGTELDFTQADFTGTVRLDVTQIMGGTKIIVPPHWEVRSEVTAVFAGFEDKRQQPAIVNPDKVLILEGTSIFGGIELKNY